MAVSRHYWTNLAWYHPVMHDWAGFVLARGHDPVVELVCTYGRWLRSKPSRTRHERSLDPFLLDLLAATASRVDWVALASGYETKYEVAHGRHEDRELTALAVKHRSALQDTALLIFSANMPHGHGWSPDTVYKTAMKNFPFAMSVHFSLIGLAGDPSTASSFAGALVSTALDWIDWGVLLERKKR